MSDFDNSSCSVCNTPMSAQDNICPNGHSVGKNLVIGKNEGINILEGYSRMLERKTIIKNYWAVIILTIVITTGIFISLDSSGISTAVIDGFLGILSIISGFYAFTRSHFKDRDTVRYAWYS